MDILNILLQLKDIAELDVKSLFEQDAPSKAILKKVRIKLKTLHPDAGGDSNEFDRLHKLYEALLAYKKKTNNYELYIKDALRVIIEGKSNGKKYDYADFDSPVVDLTSARSVHAYINISELVLHFNKLSYCQKEENAVLLCDMIRIPIKVIALEPHEQTGKLIESSMQIDKLCPHRYDSRYETYIAIEVVRGATIKLSIPGFEKEAEYTVDTPGGFVTTFNENCVKLDVKLQVSIL